ncbi:MAG TPA: hypothetical protein VH416_06575 [Gaiellaceae bacterium]|jgi:hypothetical protein
MDEPVTETALSDEAPGPSYLADCDPGDEDDEAPRSLEPPLAA